MCPELPVMLKSNVDLISNSYNACFSYHVITRVYKSISDIEVKL